MRISPGLLMCVVFGMFVHGETCAQTAAVLGAKYDATSEAAIVASVDAPNILYALEHSQNLTNWSVVVPWEVTPSPMDSNTTFVVPVGFLGGFFRLVSTTSGPAVTISGSATTAVTCIRSDAASGVVRDVATLSDGDGNGILDRLEVEYVREQETNGIAVLYATTIETVTGRYVTATSFSANRATNWGATYVSAAGDAFPSAFGAMDCGVLWAFATNNMPYFEGIGATSALVRFPKAAVTSSDEIVFSGGVEIAEVDPLIVWHFESLTLGVFGHSGFRAWGDEGGIHMRWIDPVNSHYQLLDDRVVQVEKIESQQVIVDRMGRDHDLNATAYDMPARSGEHDVSLQTACAVVGGGTLNLVSGARVKVPMKKTIVVLGISPWTATGIQVPRGGRFKVSASGTIDNNGADLFRDPNGNSEFHVNETRPWNPLPTANDMSLIGKVGNCMFSLGSSAERAVGCDGELYLGIKDIQFFDNGGSWTVVVTALW